MEIESIVSIRANTVYSDSAYLDIFDTVCCILASTFKENVTLMGAAALLFLAVSSKLLFNLLKFC